MDEIPEADARIVQLRRVLLSMTGGEAATGAGLDGLVTMAGEASRELEALRAGVAGTEQKLEALLAVVVSFVGLDYGARAQVSEANDTFDGLASGLNMLGEELAATTVSKAYMDNLLQSLRDPLLVLSEAGAIEKVNAATTTLSGYDEEALVGQPLKLLIPGLPEHALADAPALADREHELRTRSGEAVAVAVSLSALAEPVGEPGYACLLRDLTHSKQLEAERWRLREDVQRQAILLEELSNPLIPVSRDVLIVPLVGTLDRSRVDHMTHALLERVADRGARVVILDTTGVRTLESDAIGGLHDAVQSLQLLGARAMLTGIGPELARTLWNAGLELSGVSTYSTLERGLEEALGVTVSRAPSGQRPGR